VSVLTRDPSGFVAACPDLSGDESVELLPGDVRTCAWPASPFTHVVHGATPSDAQMNAHRPHEMLEIITRGTDRVLAFAASRGVRRVLLLSSGAVYAPPAPEGGFAEDDPVGSLWPAEASPYHAGKRAAESMALAAAEAGLPLTVARLFAFVGPYLPLDGHFAIGNFIADALVGRPVTVDGDGTPVRSYLYAADMAVWICTMLLDERAKGRIYNVGSEHPISIAEVARLVASSVKPCSAVVIAGGRTRPHDRYIPCTARARQELGLSETIGLHEAVRRTLAWHAARSDRTSPGSPPADTRIGRK